MQDQVVARWTPDRVSVPLIGRTSRYGRTCRLGDRYAAAMNRALRWSFLLCALCVTVLVGCGTSTSGAPVGASSQTTSPSKATTPVVVVLDGSESMQTADAPGPRIDAARSAVKTFVNDLEPQTPFGLVAYGNTMSAKTTPQATGCTDVSTPIRLAPINKAEAVQAIDGMKALGWTPLSRALTQGVETLGSDGGSLVLVSDGEATCQPDPCETARSLQAEHPNVSISTIGFKSSDAQLECIAREGGGVFVTADNAAQLSSRIDAARDADSASQRLTNTGLGGIKIGESQGAIRADNPSFPALSSGAREGDKVVVRWKDCDWVFDGETLTEIRPTNASTVDGIQSGTPMRRVIELFGEPVKVDSASSTAYFAADESQGIALRVVYSGDARTGTVRTIVLCRCLPQRSGASTSTKSSASASNGTTSKTELCAAWRAVSDVFTGPVNIINDRAPQNVAKVQRLADAAQKYPNDAVQYEGAYLAKQASSLSLSAFTSQQNIKSVCTG